MMPMLWFDKVNDWRSPAENDRKFEAQRRSRRVNIIRGWADSAAVHHQGLRGLNQLHAEFWRRKV